MADTSWDRLEAEARELPVEAAPLELGQPIAWNKIRGKGETMGLTEIHFVGLLDPPMTACRFSLPSPERRLPLSPALIRVMPKCKYCEAEIRAAKERAA